MTKSMSSIFIKYSLSRYFIIFSLLVCSYIAKSQEEEKIRFYSYESFIPTPRIGVYQFYKELIKAFPKAHEKQKISFLVLKDGSVKIKNIDYPSFGLDSLQQKFENISKWIPVYMNGRASIFNQDYTFQFGKLSDIGDVGFYFTNKDSVIIYDKNHIRYVGGKLLGTMQVSTVDYFYNKGKINKIIIEKKYSQNHIEDLKKYNNYYNYKLLEQFLVFYYGLPSSYIASPTIPVMGKESFDVIKEIENKDYSVSWNDFLDGKILLEITNGTPKLTYEFY
ncbi:hypothetical protein [Sphingobacterium sp. JUb21]|nr:hypothetical protein [Sphingobacterium sp. JUb21]